MESHGRYHKNEKDRISSRTMSDCHSFFQNIDFNEFSIGLN